MVSADILRRRLDAMLGYLDRLERFQQIARENFVADADTHHLAERYLHLAVESALEIANHLIADAGLEAPETYRDAFAILARHGVVDAALAKRLQSWAGFKNVLVHANLASVASDGKEALTLLEEQISDLVLTDVMMPVMDGLELLRAIRADPRLAHVPAIVVSAARPVLPRDPLTLFLGKPVDFDRLLELVAQHLRA